MLLTMRQPWWKKIFNQDYLTVYQETLGAARTKQEVDFIEQQLKLNTSQQILDVGCGYGRHIIEFAQRGYQVTGFDYSRKLLKEAKKRAQAANVLVTLKRGDILKLPYNNQFDIVVSLFTSIGYFTQNNDNAQALKSLCRAVRPGGYLWLDVSNTFVSHASNTITTNQPKEVKKIKHLPGQGEMLILIQYQPEGRRRIIKRDWQEHNQSKTYISNIYIYTMPELKKICQDNGLEVVSVWGGYDGSQYEEKSSKKLIIVAKKPGQYHKLLP